MPNTLTVNRSRCINSILFSVLICSLISCTNTSEKLPDVSHVKVVLKSQRLDRDLISIDTNQIAQSLVGLEQQYPDFFNFYLDTLLHLDIHRNYVDANPAISEGLHSFLTYKDYRNLFDTVAVHYPNTSDIEANLNKGFQYLQHYYPKYKTPKIVYFISGLGNWGVVSYDGVMGIGLDMFLGEKYPFYASVGQPEYMYINFRKESIAPAVFSTIYNDFHPFEDQNKTLLEMLIQKGKQQYFVEKMLPFVSAEDRIGYTNKQLEWCTANEAMIYNFFLNNQLLFEKNWSKMRRFVSYGPNTTGMPAESPGNIGTWLGLQIVKAFVKENSEMTLEQIFAEKNVEQFLRKAKYKPKN
ncbi:MAG: hypothetical protein QM530_08585 [Phycisphaerales bacterium]|nr:hypothetical protein [Phycisphaerales bacterium]